MSRVRYATPAMMDLAAQQCSVVAAWAASGFPRHRPPRESILACASWESVYLDPDSRNLVSWECWAEAEARLREGRLPPGWAWSCPLNVFGCRRCRDNAVNATTWAPGKGPSL